MQITEILGANLNISILALFYTVFGAVISYVIFHLFDDYGKEWEESGIFYQTTDVVIELVIIGMIAFWSSYLIKNAAPIFPVHRDLDHQVDSYISSVFFGFAMFLFLGDLSTKIQYLYRSHLKAQFTKIFPQTWSVTKSLFGSRKTKETKDRFN
jgi:hypothetical protein